MYNYREEMKKDIINEIRENIENGYYSTEGFEDADEFAEFLNLELFTNDSVTGNASGSYTFNSYRAKEYIFDNMDLLKEAVEMFGDADRIGELFLNEDWETMDVTIRCYLLNEMIAEALEEIEDELQFGEETAAAAQ